MQRSEPLRRSIRLALTPGEPAGIGPDLTIALANGEHLPELQRELQDDVQLELIVVADPDLLQSRARLLGKKLQLQPFDPANPALNDDPLQILPVPLVFPSQAGLVDQRNAAYVIKTLEVALDGCLEGQFDGLVTGPVHKAIINEAGIPFSGHTEWFAARIDARIESRIDVRTSHAVAVRPTKPVMMLVTEGLRVALATTHLPLSQVPRALSRDLLLQVVRILHHDLGQRFGISAPRILVCGLNPHAGEGGHLGTEEIETITPALEQLRSEGLDLTGPVPADTAFTAHSLEGVDAVLAMYHDQGLPVLKQMGFGASANITLGLPVIRTSVDHGTALDLAGKGSADLGSLITAIRYACVMSQSQPEVSQTAAAQIAAPTGDA